MQITLFKYKLFFVILCGLMGTELQAFTWNDLWKTKDQQGASALQKGRPDLAAHVFQNPDWKAVASYRAGHYQSAFEWLDTQKDPRSYYNKGNALAHLGRYKEAIEAYEKSLELNPSDPDAKFNRDLLKKLQASSDTSENTTNQQPSPSQKNDSKETSPPKEEASSSKPEPKKTAPEQTTKNNATESKKSKQPSNPPAKTSSAPSVQQQTATEKWLQQIPDDPGGLLRQKFLRDYQRMQSEEEPSV